MVRANLLLMLMMCLSFQFDLNRVTAIQRQPMLSLLPQSNLDLKHILCYTWWHKYLFPTMFLLVMSQNEFGCMNKWRWCQSPNTHPISYNPSTLSLGPVSVKPNPQSLRVISLLPAPALHECSLMAQQHAIKAGSVWLRLGGKIGSTPDWNQYMSCYENHHKS